MMDLLGIKYSSNGEGFFFCQQLAGRLLLGQCCSFFPLLTEGALAMMVMKAVLLMVMKAVLLLREGVHSLFHFMLMLLILVWVASRVLKVSVAQRYLGNTISPSAKVTTCCVHALLSVGLERWKAQGLDHNVEV